MPKKRSGRSRKSTGVKRQPAQSVRFVGDQILAIYLSLSYCCLLSACLAVGSAALSIATVPRVAARAREVLPHEVSHYIADKAHAAIIGLALFCISLLCFCLIVGTWKG